MAKTPTPVGTTKVPIPSAEVNRSRGSPLGPGPPAKGSARTSEGLWPWLPDSAKGLDRFRGPEKEKSLYYPARLGPQGSVLAPSPGADTSFGYELFNSSNISIHYRSWNYRGCWHQTCPPIDTR